jgi:hypothetical protein
MNRWSLSHTRLELITHEKFVCLGGGLSTHMGSSLELSDCEEITLVTVWYLLHPESRAVCHTWSSGPKSEKGPTWVLWNNS